MKKAVFAGTFDPFTSGHLDIVSRAAALFDEVVIAVCADGNKRPVADVKARTEIAELSIKNISGARVKTFTGALTDFMKKEGISVIVRGLRSCGDFEYERNLCGVYKSLDRETECVYLISAPELNHISASVVRELVGLSKPVDGYVSGNAVCAVNKYYGGKQI